MTSLHFQEGGLPVPDNKRYSGRRVLFLAKITIGCRIKYINRVSNSALSHVKLAICSAH
jgi:hypothetical protein